jgi:hypothetical protein
MCHRAQEREEEFLVYRGRSVVNLQHRRPRRRNLVTVECPSSANNSPLAYMGSNGVWRWTLVNYKAWVVRYHKWPMEVRWVPSGRALCGGSWAARPDPLKCSVFGATQLQPPVQSTRRYRTPCGAPCRTHSPPRPAVHSLLVPLPRR